MRIAITGSSGLIGTRLQERLRSEGHEVVPMLRGSSDDPNALWNPADGWVRPGALESVDAVVNLGGANLSEGRWSDARKRELRASRIDATRLLVDHIASLEHRPQAWVNASAVGYYGDGGEEELTEDAPLGEGFLAELVRDWEAEARRAEEAGLRTVILRCGVVLSRHGGALKKMLPPYQLGVGGPIGRGERWMSWIARDDAVTAYATAATSDWSGVYNATAQPVRNAEFVKALGAAIRRPTVLPVLSQMLQVMYGQTADEMLLVSQRVVPSRLTQAGFQHRHPDIDSGMRAAMEG
jgi:uncharacterized protein (TIGR01777 family)